MKITNRANRRVGDCPMMDPLTFLAGCQRQDTWTVQTDRVLSGLGKAATSQTGMGV